MKFPQLIISFIALCILLVTSCVDKVEPKMSISDSIRFNRIADSIGKAEYKKVLKEVVLPDKGTKTKSDDINQDEESPIHIISAKFVSEEYSRYKSVRLVFKNVSKKKIVGIKFKWKGLNAFNDPADMGSGSEGLGGGFTDDPLSPGKSDSGTWEIYSKDGKIITKAWAYEVAFSDGTKWLSQFVY